MGSWGRSLNLIKAHFGLMVSSNLTALLLFLELGLLSGMAKHGITYKLICLSLE